MVSPRAPTAAGPGGRRGTSLQGTEPSPSERSACPGPSLSVGMEAVLSCPGVLERVLGLLDAVSLTQARGVSSLWRSCSDDSASWESLCADLWRGKQNHPLEPWARLSPTGDEGQREDQRARDGIELIHLLLLFGDSGRGSPTALSYLAFLRLSSPDRVAAPLRHVIREEHISLENELRLCASESRKEVLLQQVLNNLGSSIGDLKEYKETFRRAGRLLSWRESYIASVTDSTRCSISHSVIPR